MDFNPEIVPDVIAFTPTIGAGPDSSFGTSQATSRRPWTRRRWVLRKSAKTAMLLRCCSQSLGFMILVTLSWTILAAFGTPRWWSKKSLKILQHSSQQDQINCTATMP